MTLRDCLVRGGIVDSARVCALRVATQLFFRNLFHVCDGAGRFEADADRLRSVLYGRVLSRVSRGDVTRWMIECHQAGLIKLYTAGGRGYGRVLNYGQRDSRRRLLYPDEEREKGLFADAEAGGGAPQGQPLPARSRRGFAQSGAPPPAPPPEGKGIEGKCVCVLPDAKGIPRPRAGARGGAPHHTTPKFSTGLSLPANSREAAGGDEAADGGAEGAGSARGGAGGAFGGGDVPQAEWVAGLARAWPGVDVGHELLRALDYVRAKRGKGARLTRAWFEAAWLPLCEGVAVEAGAAAADAAADAEPEPEGWREVMEGTVRGLLAGDSWEGLRRDRSMREYILRECGRRRKREDKEKEEEEEER